MKNIMNGKVGAGLIAVSSLWSAWDAIANTLNQSKEEISKVLVVDKEGKENTEDKKTIDFQQARKSWEVKKSPETKNVAGENLILDEQGVEEYFAQNGTVPYLKNDTIIDGNWPFEVIADGMACYYYLSNNDHVSITKPEGIDRVYVSWACEELGDKIKIIWHAVISFGKWSKLINVIFNNGANFTEENAEGKEIAHTDTLYFSNEVWNIPEEIKEQLTKGKWFYTGKIGLPKHHDPEYMAGCVERKSGNSTGYNPNEWGDVEHNEMEFDKFRTLNTLIEELGCVPYKEEVMKITQGNKTYSYKIQYYSLKTVWADWSTAHASIFWWNIPSHNCNIKKVSDFKEEVSYWTVEENYRANEVEAPKYYDNVGKEVTKDSLELGKTYQLKVQARPDYKITSVIVNGEEYTPTEEGAFTINFEVKENNKIEIKSSSTSGIEW